MLPQSLFADPADVAVELHPAPVIVMVFFAAEHTDPVAIAEPVQYHGGITVRSGPQHRLAVGTGDFPVSVAAAAATAAAM